MKQIILFILVLLPFCAFSQINETFDEPEIGSGWIGKDRNQFVVNSRGQLQLNIQPTASGKASIGLNSTYSANMQWEFDVLMDNVPSESNQLYVYLYQETEKFYYVRVGYSGANKLGLCRKGEQDMFPRLPNNYQKDSWVHIKVTLEDNRNWTMYSRQHTASYYIKEGSCTYLVTPVEKGQFSFKFVYTKDRSKLFCIDNVKILNSVTPTDTVPVEEPEQPGPLPTDLPQLEEIRVLTTSSLQFIFSKAVHIDKAVFSISNIGDAIRKSHADISEAVVNTLFEGELQPDSEYTISYSGVNDLSGNKLPVYSEDMVLKNEKEDPETVSPGSVLINEVMAASKGLQELPETEYVELYNTTNRSLSLAGWQFSYGGSAKLIGEVEFPAGSYAVLYRSGRDIKVDASGRAIPMANFPSSLANTGKTLQLLDASGSLIDEATYAKATPAKSWERSVEGWHLSADPRGGTPGSINSTSGSEPEQPVEPNDSIPPVDPSVPGSVPVEPGEIILNELLPSPFTDGSEYIELYNRSARTLHLTGLSVALRKADGTLSTHYPLLAIGEAMEPESYALLTKSKEGVSPFYLISSPEVLYELPKFPILANTSATIVLFRTMDEVVIDEVAYSSKWHASSVKDQKGVALERINPDDKTQDPANWTSAAQTAGYGTPGYRNSQYEVASPGGSTGIEPPVLTEGSDSYTIAYRLDKPGYSCRAYAFDVSGRRIAEIANHELLGTEGHISWSGITLDGNRLQTGVYIFYAELYRMDGEVKRYKKPFLVR